jgi:hypothetical protein
MLNQLGLGNGFATGIGVSDRAHDASVGAKDLFKTASSDPKTLFKGWWQQFHSRFLNPPTHHSGCPIEVYHKMKGLYDRVLNFINANSLVCNAHSVVFETNKE